MAKHFELVFSLPKGVHDPYELSDAVFEASYEGAVIGTGNPQFLGVEIAAEGQDVQGVIRQAAQAILQGVPAGSKIHEIRLRQETV